MQRLNKKFIIKVNVTFQTKSCSRILKSNLMWMLTLARLTFKSLENTGVEIRLDKIKQVFK